MARRGGVRQGAVMDEPTRAPTHDGAPALQLTRAEQARYVDELSELRRVRDRDLPGLLRAARAFVASDAVEEIAQIREDQVVVESRIAQLQNLLAEATLVDDDELANVVSLGHAVEVEYTRTGRTATYRLAGSGVSGGPRTVSARSPVGQALLGRAPGDVFAVEMPGGRVEELRLLSVAA